MLILKNWKLFNYIKKNLKKYNIIDLNKIKTMITK